MPEACAIFQLVHEVTTPSIVPGAIAEIVKENSFDASGIAMASTSALPLAGVVIESGKGVKPANDLSSKAGKDVSAGAIVPIVRSGGVGKAKDKSKKLNLKPDAV